MVYLPSIFFLDAAHCYAVLRTQATVCRVLTALFCEDSHYRLPDRSPSNEDVEGEFDAMTQLRMFALLPFRYHGTETIVARHRMLSSNTKEAITKVFFEMHQSL
jgi:hypothetical protein